MSQAYEDHKLSIRPMGRAKVLALISIPARLDKVDNDAGLQLCTAIDTLLVGQAVAKQVKVTYQEYHISTR